MSAGTQGESWRQAVAMARRELAGAPYNRNRMINRAWPRIWPILLCLRPEDWAVLTYMVRTPSYADVDDLLAEEAHKRPGIMEGMLTIAEVFQVGGAAVEGMYASLLVGAKSFWTTLVGAPISAGARLLPEFMQKWVTDIDNALDASDGISENAVTSVSKNGPGYAMIAIKLLTASMRSEIDDKVSAARAVASDKALTDYTNNVYSGSPPSV